MGEIEWQFLPERQKEGRKARKANSQGQPHSAAVAVREGGTARKKVIVSQKASGMGGKISCQLSHCGTLCFFHL